MQVAASVLMVIGVAIAKLPDVIDAVGGSSGEPTQPDKNEQTI